MTQKLEIYKCPVCDTVVEVLEQFGLELLCCGRSMEPVAEKTHQLGRERHCPILQWTDEGLRVTVGPLPHVMKEQHRIEWIEVLADGICYRQFLKPGQAPEAIFRIPRANRLTVRDYCTVHGLWKTSTPACMSQCDVTDQSVVRAAV